MPSAGSLCSAGITPRRRYYGPVRRALAFAVLRLSARISYLVPRDFSAGRGALPCFHPCPCARAAALYPAERRVPQIGSGAPAAFAVIVPARRSGLQMTGPRPDVHASLRPVHSLTPLNGALSVGFAVGISHAGATQATRFRSITASGLSPYGSTGTFRHHTIKSAGALTHPFYKETHGVTRCARDGLKRRVS